VSTLRLVWIVLTKELRDGMRDRRSILTVLVSAALTPVLLGGMFTVMAGRGKNAEEIKLPVAGVEYAPAFIDWLKQQTGVEIVAAPADPEQAVRDRKEDVVLIIEKDFSKNMARAIPAAVKLVSDATRDSARRKVTRARTLVTTYSGQLAALRLIARGVAPSVALPVRVEEVEVSSAQERLANLLSILPLLLVLAALTGGMQIAIDTTAGERERGSLEPLLINPRFGLYLLAIGALALLAYFVRSERGAENRQWAGAAIIGVNVLALLALHFEVMGYFQSQLAAAYSFQERHSIMTVRDFAYSAVWMVYGSGLMLVGFWKHSAFLRWQAIVLLAMTVFKVFLVDISTLERGYRIAAFIVLGAILLAVSFFYQRSRMRSAA